MEVAHGGRRVLPVVALLLLLAGCVDDHHDQALVSKGSQVSVCQPASPDGRVTFGAGVAKNDSDESVQVSKVELVDADGLELVGAKVMFIPVKGEGNVLGTGQGWPPEPEDDDDSELEDAVAAADDLDGATIAPTETERPSFVIGVKADPAGGSSGPLRITYQIGGDTQTWTGTTSFRVGGPDGC